MTRYKYRPTMILSKMQTHASSLKISAQFLNNTRCKLYSYLSKRSTIGHAPLHYYSYNTEQIKCGNNNEQWSLTYIFQYWPH